MERIDIANALASPQNEEWLKSIFCCQFEECEVGRGSDPELGYFVRLNFDCRTGKLFADTYSVQESAGKQLYQRHGAASLNFMPVFSVWINSDAPAYFHWAGTDLYPLERMEAAGWEQWRQDAEQYIENEYPNYPIVISNKQLASNEPEDI